MLLQVFVQTLVISYGSPTQYTTTGPRGVHYWKLPGGSALHSACLRGFCICNLSVSFLITASTCPLPGKVDSYPLYHQGRPHGMSFKGKI